MKMEQTQCSETSDFKYHTPENNTKDYTRQVFKKLSNTWLPGRNGCKIYVLNILDKP
jgi:hypothetical protein